MANPQQLGPCPHQYPYGPAICSACAVALLAYMGSGTVTSSSGHAGRLRNYTQEQVVQGQAQADLMALYSQPPTPRQIWADDRTVANSLVGASTPAQLPVTYPYARSIDIGALPSPAEPQRPPLSRQPVVHNSRTSMPRQEPLQQSPVASNMHRLPNRTSSQALPGRRVYQASNGRHTTLLSNSRHVPASANAPAQRLPITRRGGYGGDSSEE